MTRARGARLLFPTLGFLALGVAVGGWFLWRGPAVATPAHPLVWETAAPDAGLSEAEAVSPGVSFLRLQDPELPALWRAALHRDGGWAPLADVNHLHVVERDGRRRWLVCESFTEGPGPTLDLLLSEDDGETFELRASVPKPNFQATFEGLVARGDSLALTLSLDDEVPLVEPWAWELLSWAWRFDLGPTVGPGRVVLRSRNGGRTWRLER